MTSNLDGELTGKFVAAILGGVVTYLLTYLGPKAKLVVWFPHSFRYEQVTQGVTIETQSYGIQNLGRKTAEGIQIVHKRRPDFFRFWPLLNYDEGFSPSGEHVLTVSSLSAKESFSLEILSHTSLPEFQYIRSKEGYAEHMQFSLQPQLPMRHVFIFRFIFALGGVALIYICYTLGKYAAWTIQLIAP